MRRFYKLSALTLTMLSLAACDSSDDEELSVSLQRDLDQVQAFQLLVSDGDLWMTDMSGFASRLASGSNEWEFAVNGIYANGTYLFNPAPQQFVMTSELLRTFSVSNDNAENWQLYQGISEHPVEFTTYSAMLQIDHDVYMHAGEGLHRTHLNINRPEESFAAIEVLHESGYEAAHPFENRVRALIHNQPRNQLWWTEFGSALRDDYRVMRLDLTNQEVEQVFAHDSNPMLDGFVDDTDPNTLVLAGDDGVRVSYDNGQTWTLHSSQQGNELTAYSVQQDLVSLNYYAYVNVMIDNLRTDQMWCSSDQGSSWTSTTLASGNDGIRSSRGPMVFHDRSGTRYFFIPTFNGVVSGALDQVSC